MDEILAKRQGWAIMIIKMNVALSLRVWGGIKNSLMYLFVSIIEMTLFGNCQ